MDYVYLQGSYFKSFINSERFPSFKAYVDYNRQERVWGENI